MTVVEDGVAAAAAATFATNFLSQGVDVCGAGGCNNPIAALGVTPGQFASVLAQARQMAAVSWIQKIPVVESGSGGSNGRIADFACSFVAHAATGGDTLGTDLAYAAEISIQTNNVYINGPTTVQLCTNGPSAQLCGGLALPAPPASPPPAEFPDYQCHYQSITDFATPFALLFGGTDGVTGTLVQLINNWLASNVQGEMAKYGWASAGAYYSKVASMNVAAQNMTQPTVTFTPGVLSTVQQTCDIEIGTAVCNPTGVGYRTATVMQKYATWYDSTTQTGKGNGLPGTQSNGVTSLANASGSASGVSFEVDKTDTNTGLSAKSIASGGQKALNSVLMKALGIPENRRPFMVNLVGSVSDNTLPMANLSAIGQKMVIWGGMMLIAVSLIQGIVGSVNFFASTIALGLSCAFTMIFSMCQVVITAGITLAFYIPLMPFIRSAFAVMTWMVSVFEAVVMVPIAALAHLSTEGEGLKGGAGRCWVLWLNVLTRPILTVIGFIGAYIVYDAWVVYFTTAFAAASGNALDQDNIIMKLLGYCYDAVVYVSTCYAAANTVFKMVDVMPNALLRWMPSGGASTDTSFADAAQASASYASSVGKSVGDAAHQGSVSLKAGSRQMARAWYANRMLNAAGGNAKVAQGSGGNNPPPAGGGGGGGGGNPPSGTQTGGGFSGGGPSGGGSGGGGGGSSAGPITYPDLSAGLGAAFTDTLSTGFGNFMTKAGATGLALANFMVTAGNNTGLQPGGGNPTTGGSGSGGNTVAQIANPRGDAGIAGLNALARGLGALVGAPNDPVQAATNAGIELSPQEQAYIQQKYESASVDDLPVEALALATQYDIDQKDAVGIMMNYYLVQKAMAANAGGSGGVAPAAGSGGISNAGSTPGGNNQSMVNQIPNPNNDPGITSLNSMAMNLSNALTGSGSATPPNPVSILQNAMGGSFMAATGQSVASSALLAAGLTNAILATPPSYLPPDGSVNQPYSQDQFGAQAMYMNAISDASYMMAAMGTSLDLTSPSVTVAEFQAINAMFGNSPVESLPGSAQWVYQQQRGITDLSNVDVREIMQNYLSELKAATFNGGGGTYGSST
jgi:uncharacterized membrane protein YgcG